MPVTQLNNIATQDNYADALTVVFAFPRPAFSLNITNKAIMYKLAVRGTSDTSRDISWEALEHQLVPSLNSFRDPANEGFAPGSKYVGIQVRSAAIGQPANVTII